MIFLGDGEMAIPAMPILGYPSMSSRGALISEGENYQDSIEDTISEL